MIDLKDFVNQTLSQIVEGVNAFNDQHSKQEGSTTVKAMPISGQGIDEKAAANLAKMGFIKVGTWNYATVVNFDVAVVAEEGENAKAGGGLKIFPVQLGGNLEASKNQASTSRISFPISLMIGGIK